MQRRSFIALALLAAACGTSQPSGTPSATPHERAHPMTKRVLLAMTSHDKKGNTGEATGAYLAEVSHPLEVFRTAGFEVEFASVRGGKVPLDGVDRNDRINAAFLDDEKTMAKLHTSLPSAEVDPSRYDAIFFAGGHGAMWDLPSDPGFASVAARIYERGGVVAAVCHGPAALVDVKLADGRYLVAGKDVSAFTNDEERAVKLETVVPFLLADRLAERGARLHEAPLWQKQVSVSERLVTGQNPASAAATAEAVVALLAKPTAKP